MTKSYYFSHTENRLVTAETELTKERESNRLKQAKLENIVERLKEELNLKSSEIIHLNKQMELTQMTGVTDGHHSGKLTDKAINRLKYEFQKIKLIY